MRTLEILKELSAYKNASDYDKDIMEGLITGTFREGEDSIINYIEAEAEWVKEDVSDGNYGYFRVDKKLLEDARIDLLTQHNSEV